MEPLAVTGLALRSYENYCIHYGQFKKNKQDYSYHHFYSTNYSSFSKSRAYITHNATRPLSDNTGDDLLELMQLLLEPK